jgi:dihydroorotase-like cyclic amidohydrolase
MITDDDVERAVDFLRDNAVKSGALRGDRIYAEHYLKHLKAILMVHSEETSIGAQEKEAYSDDRYREHLQALRNIVSADEENRALREAAALKIEVWRTEQANVRGKL